MPNNRKYTREAVFEAMRERSTRAAQAAHLGCDERYLRRLISEYGLNQQPGATTEHRQYKDEDGKLVQVWWKNKFDDQQKHQAIRELADALKQDIKPAKPIKLKSHDRNKDLLAEYIITDYHLGMMAWGEESGENWNLKKAEQVLFEWFRHGIERAPDTETAIFAQLGDFLHWDGMKAITPTHGHLLDADTRFQKLIRVAIRVIRQIINMLLEKHKTVYLVHATGNHDESTSPIFREMLSAFYDDEPRLIIDNAPDVYYVHHFGCVSLFYHHGHKRAPKELDRVFAAKFPQVFGQTEFRYGRSGHRHHSTVNESQLMKIEQFNTLAANDAHSSQGGYISQRLSPVFVHHKDYGEIYKITIPRKMLKV